MKSNQSNETNTPSTDKKLQRAEAAINARLLYLYVGQPEMSYDSWAASLHHMVASPGHASRYRLMTRANGELALNVEFATYFAQQVSGDIMGAIALILLQEGCRVSEKNDVDNTNRMLNQFRGLAMKGGQSNANALHAFLQIEQTCKQWVARLKKKYGMVYGRDYIRMTYGRQATTKRHQKDTGKGVVIFGPRFAMKIAAGEPTRRGKLIRSCFENAPHAGSF
jgi:phage anti-repressor protein